MYMKRGRSNPVPEAVRTENDDGQKEEKWIVTLFQ